MRIKIFRTVGVLLVASLVSLSVSAQSQMFNKDDKDLSIGIGFGSPIITSGYHGVVPPIAVTFDYGLRDDWGPGVFGIGAYVGTSVYKSKYSYYLANDSYGYRYATFVIASRATYHYTFVDKLDTYGGAIIGVRITTNSKYGTWPTGTSYTPDNGFSPVGSVFIGAKYYFTDNFAAYSELGAGIAYFTIGATFKF